MERETALRSLPHFLLFLLISLLLIFFENLGWMKSFHSATEKGAAPVKLIFYQGGQQARRSLAFFTFWRSGQQKIKYLEERNREFLVEAQKARALEGENRVLRLQLGLSAQESWDLQLAQTLGKTRYLTINKGEKEGVKIGQAVILKNILVGKVVEVSLHESRVELPTDPDSKIPSRTSKTFAQGLLVGQFGKGMNLEKVTQGESLEVEDWVVTTGEGGYPKGLIVGKISWVEKMPSEVFQKAGIEPAVNYEELELVFLIKSE